MNARYLFIILLTHLALPAHARAQPDVFLAPLSQGPDGWQPGQARNVSNGPGYDNQPAFLSESELLYAGSRDGQTDIARFDLEKNRLTWLSATPGGGEYSPLPIPGRSAVSAIRLDTTGLQRLYAYPLDGELPSLLHQELKVGYHVWAGSDLLVCTVLVDDRMDLAVVNLAAGSVKLVQRGVGRTLHKIPGSNRISYSQPDAGGILLNALVPETGTTSTLCRLPEDVQDICWLPDGTLLAGQENRLLALRPASDSAWTTIASFPDHQLSGITRLAVSPGGTWLAFAAEPR